MNENQPIGVHAWTKAILFMLLALLFSVFILLNMGAVIEPRVHLVFFRYERPGLLMVLLLTATMSFIAGLSARAVLAIVREIRAARRRVDAESLERETVGLKAAANADVR
jgi:hypothetical protein